MSLLSSILYIPWFGVFHLNKDLYHRDISRDQGSTKSEALSAIQVTKAQVGDKASAYQAALQTQGPQAE